VIAWSAVLYFRDTGHAAVAYNCASGLMNRKTFELCVLATLAVLGFALAWGREERTFITVFAAEAVLAIVAAVYLSRRGDA